MEKTWLTGNLDIQVPNSVCYENNPENCSVYGRLYTKAEALTGCQALGNGWRLPTPQEWQSLVNSFGGFNNSIGFNTLILGGSSGFDALQGGLFASGTSSFSDLADWGAYWADDSAGGSDTIFFIVNTSVIGASIDSNKYSVRCIKD